jgi:aspartate/methionine/tyrosine aminotransferase
MTEHGKWISQGVAGIAISAIKDMAMRSARVKGAASLTWGVPSFPTPDHIRDAVTRGLADDPEIGKYSLPDGIRPLREAAARHHQARTGRATDADAHVLITAGNIQGLNALFHATIDPGDEVIMTDPGFASHVLQIALCGGKPVFWALDREKGWALDSEALAGLIGPRTKAIVLVSPSNPTGRIFREAELKRMAAIARDRGLLVIVDDPYSHFLYENEGLFCNPAALGELTDNLAYLYTFSKAYAMSGWRMAYMVVPEHLKRQTLKVHDATVICAPRVSQVGALAALEAPPDHMIEFNKVLARRRDLICDRLDRVGHVFDYVKPEGAYYVFPRIVADHRDSVDFAIRLLEDAHVTVTPGSAFGPQGEHHVRMAFCMDDDIINLAFDRIEAHFGK